MRADSRAARFPSGCVACSHPGPRRFSVGKRQPQCSSTESRQREGATWHLPGQMCGNALVKTPSQSGSFQWHRNRETAAYSDRRKVLSQWRELVSCQTGGSYSALSLLTLQMRVKFSNSSGSFNTAPLGYQLSQKRMTGRSFPIHAIAERTSAAAIPAWIPLSSTYGSEWGYAGTA